ncbi:MAG: phosphoribosylamine--glycine ligase [Methyloligellaceae bacterium]
MNVLLIGSGGREHSLAWALTKSALLDKLYCMPGNGGTQDLAESVEISVNDHNAIIDFCRSKDIGLVVVGPEAPLTAGLADDLDAAGILVFGPRKKAAQLEGSKSFTNDLCEANDIPTAKSRTFTDAASAKSYVREQGAPIVVKADGLAAGKGVTVASSIDEAIEAVDQCFGGAFGDAGVKLVVEECLVGEEASFFALVDGDTALPMATAQDHKRALDGDQGPNTGGMGAYSPAPVMTEALCNTVMKVFIEPTIAALREQETPFHGILYAGLMITDDGPKLIEYNVRFGDPECQVLMMRLKSDLLTALLAAAEGRLNEIELQWHDDPALTVVMVSEGYPGSYEKGSVINGLAEASGVSGVEIFHAGTERRESQVIATGGRVLNVTARAETIRMARDHAYEAVARIKWPAGRYRADIGWRALERED